MGTYYTAGIILRHEDRRDTDRLITLYTREFGKIKVIARGLRKITSKLAGNLEPYSQADFMLAKGRQLDTVAALEVSNNYKKLKQNLLKVNLACYLSAIVDSATKEHHRDQRIFNLISQIFTYLDSHHLKVQQQYLIACFFVWRLLSYLGFQPELFYCVVCRKKIKPVKIFFSNLKGGLICASCQLRESGVAAVSDDVIKLLRLALVRDLAAFTKIRVNNRIMQELNQLTDHYLSNILEKQVSLRDFL